MVQWPSVAGKQYIIQRSPVPFNGPWTSIATNIGTGGPIVFHDTTGGAVRYYRVSVAP